LLQHLSAIVDFMLRQYLHLWPYLLLTVPLAVAVRLSCASRYIKKALSARPLTAILSATLVGAFSPFCSCGVIPMIAALLTGGVPIAPVMAFWLASPSMDPEIFLLTVAKLGWELAVWRLAATFLLSLGGGYLTQLAAAGGWLGGDVLRQTRPVAVSSPVRLLRKAAAALRPRAGLQPAMRSCCASAARPAPAAGARLDADPLAASCAYSGAPAVAVAPAAHPVASPAPARPARDCGCTFTRKIRSLRRLAAESASVTLWMLKLMSLAFFLEALIVLYLPASAVSAVLGASSRLAVPLATLVGIPVYTTNLAAVGMVAGLLQQGMSPAAALSFLIAGATTTLPAMSAVFTLVRPRVFLLYLGFTCAAALLFGYLFQLGRLLF
jgi:uncharacterized membrane protein YraQ (UPF0718 family)